MIWGERDGIKREARARFRRRGLDGKRGKGAELLIIKNPMAGLVEMHIKGSLLTGVHFACQQLCS